MFRHILRLVWNRKTSNLLILLEIFFTFLVLFAVTAFAVFSWRNAQRPMGFDLTDVWELRIQDDSPESSRGEPTPERIQTEMQIKRLLESDDKIEAVSVIAYSPYQGSSSTRGWTTPNEVEAYAELISASVDHPKVFGMTLVAGRFFEEADAFLPYQPTVINRFLAEEVFGTVDCLGKEIDAPSEDRPNQSIIRVVGVVDDFRKRGEFSAAHGVMFRPHFMGEKAERTTPFFALKMNPGTSLQYEAEIIRKLAGVAPGWSFGIGNLESRRENYRRERLMALALAATVAAFLIMMVVLGLLGVLWQSISRRTVEIGVRRAKGAGAPRIYQQILGELVAVAGAAILLATVVVVQLPLTNWLEFVDVPVAWRAYLISVAIMLFFVVMSGLYPSWLASRVQPAEALHYD